MVRKKKSAIEVKITTTKYIPTGREPLSAQTISGLELQQKLRESFDALASFAEAPDAQDRDDFQSLMSSVDDFGIGQLSIITAANLIAAERWLVGEVQADLPEDKDFQFDDPRLLAALQPEIDQIRKQLLQAIDRGELVPSLDRRAWASGAIVPERTFIAAYDLRDWLMSREFVFGEFFEAYESREEEVQHAILHDLFNMRMVLASGDAETVEERWTQFLVNRGPKLNSDQTDIASRSHDQLVVMVEQALSEVSRLQGELARIPRTTVDVPLHPKRLRALNLVIAAFCQKVKIDPQDRNATRDLRLIIEQAGLFVDDEVLRKIVKALPGLGEG